MGLLDRLAQRRTGPASSESSGSRVEEPVFATKALRKFVATLSSKDSPTLLDLAPVVGGNLNFFGDQLGCKVLIEDIYADIERHTREQKLADLPAFLSNRFTEADASIDGILCWDVLDYLARPAVQAIVDQLTRVLKPEGALLAFFGTLQPRDAHYTRYAIVDDGKIQYRTYPAAQARQVTLANRDIIRIFERLRVSDSFLLQNNLREILFRKPAYEAR